MTKGIVRVWLRGQSTPSVVAAIQARTEEAILQILDDAGELVAEFQTDEVVGWSRDTAPVRSQRYGRARRTGRQEDEEE